MLLVAVDTSGRKGSVALCRGDRDSFATLQLTPLEGGTYSALLMPAIAETLQQHAVARHQVDCFVVVSGPGSFTGLRVGLATLKGLAEVLQKPLVAVSMLESVALARASGAGQFTVALDAGRSELYVGEFELSGHRAALLRESILKQESFSAGLDPAATVLTPDAKVADALRGRANVRLVEPVGAGEIGGIGLRKFLDGELADPATLDANYIRRSDAELFSLPNR